MTRWLLLALLALPTTPAHAAPTVNTVGGLTVFDASNRVVGAMFGSPLEPMVVLEIDGKLIPIFVRAPGFAGVAPIFFESIDCTGPGFMLPPVGPSMIVVAAVHAPGATVYLPGPGPTQTISARSAISNFASGTGPAVFCSSPISPFAPLPAIIPDVTPAVAILNLNTRFTPPLSLRPTVGITSTFGAPALSLWAQVLAVGLLLASGVWFVRQRRAEEP